MPANGDPIYSKAGAVGLNAGGAIRPANAFGIASYRSSTYDGTNTTTDQIVFTADATNGSFVQRLRFKALGTNVIAVARIYINNGSAQGTAANNVLYGEMSLPATTASTNAATVDLDYPLGFALPAGYKIIVGVSAAADLASGWVITPVAGNY